MFNNYIPLKFLGARSVWRLLTALLFLLPLIAPQAFAQLKMVHIYPLTYSLDDEKKEAKVWGLQADFSTFNNLSIPSYIQTSDGVYDVTSIKEFAFSDGSKGKLTGTLTLPFSIKEIGFYAFGYCTGLTGTLTIPQDTKTIGANAFRGCSGFTELKFQTTEWYAALNTIDDAAFYKCGFKGALVLPESVKTIGNGAFNQCAGLTGTLTIPKNVESVGENAFNGCSGFSALTVGAKVQTIGRGAFDGCSGLKSVTSNAATPPTIGDGSNKAFSVTTQSTAPLNVASTSLKLYRAAFDWKDFKTIKGDKPEPSSVSLDKPSATLNVGGTVQLTATISPSDAYNEKLTWSTSNASVATVDANGKVTALSRGTANITVTTDNGKTATCAVTVNQPVTSVSVDLAASGFTGGKAEMRVSESKTLKVTVNPANANDKTLTYSSSNAGIVSVDNNGVIKANALGSAIITVTASSGVKTTLTVTVVATPAERINLNKTTETLKATETLQLTAEVLPATTTDKTVKWTSSNNAVATVDGNGKVTAVAVGAANITATCGTVSATCSVTVVPTPAESVNLNKTTETLKVTNELQLTATILPATTTDKTVTWTSSDSAVATVDANGKVTAVSVGKATITATCGTVSGTCTVTVVPMPASSVTLNQSETSLKATETVQLTAEILPVTTTDKTVTWTSSDNAVATVDNDGLVTAVAVGIVNITATCGTVSGTCVITVVPTPAESVTLDVTEATLNVPETLQLNATILPATTTDKLTWSSSNEAVATVDGNGKVTAVKVGEATITVTTTSGKSATLKVTVLQPASGVEIDFAASGIEGDDLMLNVGESKEIKVTVTPADSTDKLTWTSSNPEIATVDANGKVTAIKAGEATITVTTTSGKSATLRVTVLQPSSGVEIDFAASGIEGENMTLNVGESKEIKVTVTPADSTDKLTWSSSNEAVATVDANGKVTAVKAGEATITVTTTSGKSATLEVTVLQPSSGVEIDFAASGIEGNDLTLNVGESKEIKVTVTPADSTDKLTWSSSDSSVATVDAYGKVTAVKAGEATITVTTTSGKSATLKVTVLQPALGIAIDYAASGIEGDTLVINVPDSREIKVTVTPDDSTDSLTWTSSDEAIATVDATGKVTAVKAGEAIITVTTTSGKSATLKVTVLQPATGIELNEEKVDLKVGETAQLAAAILPDESTDTEVVWATSDASIATVDANGLVTAIALGEAEITVSVKANPAIKAICKVAVVPTLATVIYLDKYNMTTVEGVEFDLVATVLPDDATDKTVAWSSSDDTIATVDDKGHVKVLGSGECDIIAATTDGSDLKATCKLNALSGVYMIWSDSGNRPDIYSINGTLVKKGCSLEDYMRLEPGIYIVGGQKILKR